MTEFSKLIQSIIPPDDHSHRNGFSNEAIIENLTDSEKIEVENQLIQMLSRNRDLLIVETLAYMKSSKALPLLGNILDSTKNSVDKIIIASSIYKIQKDPGLCEIVLQESKKVTNHYSLTLIFFYMATMQDENINEEIRKYTTHKDYLVSYNAKLYIKD